ncbi:MAG: cyclic 2,3-diphosphoglycerate synthase [Bacteroidota bacterium]
MARTRVLIMGAAGRDFHNFNVHFRNKPEYEVVAFTATQIPNIADRLYPPELAGPHYPQGIRIFPEADLEKILTEHPVDQVIFAYSDVPHEYVMHIASRVLAHGPDFRLMGLEGTALKSRRPVVAVCAVRTGGGKSQTTRKVADLLKGQGLRVVVVRHPMPYGNLTLQASQRFVTYADLDRHECTIEEREEYEPHLDRGTVVYAGVDYERILRAAEEEADVILWDGGNNDLPFYRPDLYITVVDPHRPGHELAYHPGEANLRRADVVIINKVDTAGPQDVERVRANIMAANPRALIIEAASPIFLDEAEPIRGRRVLVVEDGPTLTHGEMPYGAGVVAARKFGAGSLVDPRPFAVGSLKETFRKYPHIGALLPAMGYGAKQMEELQATINASDAEVVVIGTPIDLRRVIRLEKPAVRVRYELQEIGQPDLAGVLARFVAEHAAARMPAGSRV